MKKGRRVKALALPEMSATFTRGMVAAALLTAVQERWTGGAPPSGRKILRYALQGGAALAAGTAAAEAVRSRNAAGAVLAVAAGVAGVVALEHLLNPADTPANPENAHG